MFIRLMHTGVARAARAAAGFLLVVEAVYQPLGVAAIMVVLGTVVAVTGIADVCIVEQVTVAWRRARIAAPAPHESHV